MEFLKITQESEEEFEGIAQILFDNYAINSHGEIYRFAEIEFYWNSSSHVDKSTYNRNHANPDSGEWFFHYSGVDIALRNTEAGGYGGILIRGIYNVNKGTLTKGPMVCAMKLFSGFNAFTETIQTRIIPYNFDKSTIIKSKRVGLGKAPVKSGADKLNYSFRINPK